MSSEFLRYTCQMNLPGFGELKQQLLKKSKVLIIGMGGLGCPASIYLASSGIGTLGIADYDKVSISNLHRQILYTPDDVGKKKVRIAGQRLKEQNPDCTIIEEDIFISPDNIMKLIQLYDIIIDATDNFDARYLINDACVLSGKPVVYGAIYQYEGQVAVWNVPNEDHTFSPHYRDVFPHVNTTQIPDCTEGGVIPTLAGMIGCLQANEAIKYITQTGSLLKGKLMIWNAETMQSRIIKLADKSRTNITALPQVQSVPVISIGELKKAIADNKVELIDVRSPEEHMVFNIGGKNIALNTIAVDHTYLHTTKPVVFYCASGKRSSEATKIACKQFPDRSFYSLEGGLKAWREANIEQGTRNIEL